MSSGALGFTSSPDFEAPADADGDNVYEVVVSATDGTLSDAQALLVTVANANEAVSITSGGAFTLAENGTGVTTVTNGRMWLSLMRHFRPVISATRYSSSKRASTSSHVKERRRSSDVAGSGQCLRKCKLNMRKHGNYLDPRSLCA